MTVDLSTFMQKVIERIGREPDSVNGNIYAWMSGRDEIQLIVGSEHGDIQVDLYVNPFASDHSDSYYHRYVLTEFEDWNGLSIGSDGSEWTYNELIEAVGFQVASNINLG